MLKLVAEMVKANGQLVARVSAHYASDRPPHIDRVTLDSSRSRSRFAKDLQQVAGIPPEDVERELLKIADEQARQPALSQEKPQEAPPLTPEARQAAEEYLRSPGLLDRIASDIQTMGVVGERELSLTVYLLLSSRVLKRPLKAVVQGPSSSGKTYVVEQVAKLFPEETLFRATSLSDQAWYYLPEDAILHKAVILGEREQSNDPARIDARRAWRELMASDEASRVVTVLDPITRQPKSTKRTVRGPCAFIETTTSESLMDEDASRMLPLHPCETREQTARILSHIALAAAGQSPSDQQRQTVISLHRAVQKLLSEQTGIDVVIPYAAHISIPADQVIARRVLTYVLGMIQSVASIRRLQKPADLRGQADLVDYDVAYPLLLPLVLRQLSRITDVDVESLRSVAGSHMDTFTAPRAAELWGISERQARRRLRRLESAGLIAETDSSRKNRNEYRLTDKEAAAADTGLPTPDALREAVAEREAIQREPSSTAPAGNEMSDEP